MRGQTPPPLQLLRRAGSRGEIFHISHKIDCKIRLEFMRVDVEEKFNFGGNPRWFSLARKIQELQTFSSLFAVSSAFKSGGGSLMSPR